MYICCQVHARDQDHHHRHHIDSTWTSISPSSPRNKPLQSVRQHVAHAIIFVYSTEECSYKMLCITQELRALACQDAEGKKRKYDRKLPLVQSLGLGGKAHTRNPTQARKRLQKVVGTKPRTEWKSANTQPHTGAQASAENGQILVAKH